MSHQLDDGEISHQLSDDATTPSQLSSTQDYMRERVSEHPTWSQQHQHNETHKTHRDEFNQTQEDKRCRVQLMNLSKHCSQSQLTDAIQNILGYLPDECVRVHPFTAFVTPRNHHDAIKVMQAFLHRGYGVNDPSRCVTTAFARDQRPSAASQPRKKMACDFHPHRPVVLSFRNVDGKVGRRDMIEEMEEVADILDIEIHPSGAGYLVVAKPSQAESIIHDFHDTREFCSGHKRFSIGFSNNQNWNSRFPIPSLEISRFRDVNQTEVFLQNHVYRRSSIQPPTSTNKHFIASGLSMTDFWNLLKLHDQPSPVGFLKVAIVQKTTGSHLFATSNKRKADADADGNQTRTKHSRIDHNEGPAANMPHDV
jgi:hypothetical protein